MAGSSLPVWTGSQGERRGICYVAHHGQGKVTPQRRHKRNWRPWLRGVFKPMKAKARLGHQRGFSKALRPWKTIYQEYIHQRCQLQISADYLVSELAQPNLSRAEFTPFITPTPPNYTKSWAPGPRLLTAIKKGNKENIKKSRTFNSCPKKQVKPKETNKTILSCLISYQTKPSSFCLLWLVCFVFLLYPTGRHLIKKDQINKNIEVHYLCTFKVQCE